MTTESILNRLQALEDAEEIKRLKAQYCNYCDQPFNADALIKLFADDAVWEADGIGRFEGKDEIYGFFKNITERLTFAVHYVMNPIIDVQGNSAQGSWYLWEPGTIKGRDAIWISGSYTDEYQKVDGVWKFKNVHLDWFFRASVEKGWAEDRMATFD